MHVLARESSESSGTLVLGLGNELLRDDGVGLVAARRVAELAGDRARLVEACVATVDLLEILAGHERVVVVDAYVSESVPPGTPVHAGPDDLPRGFGYRSFHTLSFAEMLVLGRRLGLEMPREISIHGLSVEDPGTFGETFSAGVALAWPSWAERIAEIEFGRPARRSSDRAGPRAATLGQQH